LPLPLASGGALAIESAPGRGTTVRLWFPAADARNKAAQVQPVIGQALLKHFKTSWWAVGSEVR
jgi:hypothetical protein